MKRLLAGLARQGSTSTLLVHAGETWQWAETGAWAVPCWEPLGAKYLSVGLLPLPAAPVSRMGAQRYQCLRSAVGWLSHALLPCGDTAPSISFLEEVVLV